MKLAELKEKFKNKYVIRMVCGVLMIAVLGSSSTVYTVYAAKNNTENEIAAESAKILGEETANVKEIGKEETVYIIADSEGKAQSTIETIFIIRELLQKKLRLQKKSRIIWMGKKYRQKSWRAKAEK